MMEKEEDNITSNWKNLRKEMKFLDVTLACDNGQVEAHRVILSAMSPVFKKILHKTPYEHPIIFITGIQWYQLIALLDYIYLGEVSLNKKDIYQFLAILEEFKIENKFNKEEYKKHNFLKKYKSDSNLTQNILTVQLAEIDRQNYDVQNSMKTKTEHTSAQLWSASDNDYHFNQKCNSVTKSPEKVFKSKSCIPTKVNLITEVSIDLSEESDTEDSSSDENYKMNMRSKISLNANKSMEPNYFDKNNENQTKVPTSQLWSHIKNDYFKHKYKSKSNSTESSPNAKDCTSDQLSLNSNENINNVHTDESYEVNKITELEKTYDQVSTDTNYHKNKSNLMNQQVKNEVFRTTNENFKTEEEKLSSCELCNYKAKHKVTLKEHVESKHLGIRYACNQCEHSLSRKKELKKHMEIVHLGIRYPCNQCKYSSARRYDLKVHVKGKHLGVRQSCNQCGFSTIFSSALKKHIQIIHDGIRYTCDQCDFEATLKSKVESHINEMHHKLGISQKS